MSTVTRAPEWTISEAKRLPIPPVPPKPITLDSIMEDLLRCDIYRVFKLDRHPNPLGVWNLEKNERYSTPETLTTTLATLDPTAPLGYNSHRELATRRKVKAMLVSSLLDEQAARTDNPTGNSSAYVGIHLRQAFHCEGTILDIRQEFDGKLDFAICNAEELGTQINALVWVDPYPLSILWQCISLMGAVHNAREHENKRITAVYGIATNGEEFYFIEIDDNGMVSWHRSTWSDSVKQLTNEVYSYMRRFFHDITGRNSTPLPGTQMKPPKHAISVW